MTLVPNETEQALNRQHDIYAAAREEYRKKIAEQATRIEQLEREQRLIVEERDRTFALMLARAEQAEERIKHWSGCAVHNMPAMPAGFCDCGGYTDAAMDEIDRLRAALRNIRDKNREMNMGDLSAEEALWEADSIARAALGDHCASTGKMMQAKEARDE